MKKQQFDLTPLLCKRKGRIEAWLFDDKNFKTVIGYYPSVKIPKNGISVTKNDLNIEYVFDFKQKENSPLFNIKRTNILSFKHENNKFSLRVKINRKIISDAYVQMEIYFN